MKTYIEAGEEQEKKFQDIPVYELGETPDSIYAEQPILANCIRIKRAILAGYDSEYEMPMPVVDVLIDLRHLCDAMDLDFADCDRVAYDHYIEELEEQRGD